MKNKIAGLIGALWGGAILLNGLNNSEAYASQSYQSGQTAGLVFGGLMLVVGLVYLFKK